jgi:sterol desaturase/sphingolipid hydroxylase (fatty acid hydroxylase superfamily)
MAFLLGPVLRNVGLSTLKEVIFWIMPKMISYMPTVAAVTTTAGLITLHPPVAYCIFAVLVIVVAMLVHGLGILLPTNIRIYFELRKSEPNMSKIQKLMRRYVKVFAIQTLSQFIIMFIMAEFATGFSLPP